MKGPLCLEQRTLNLHYTSDLLGICRLLLLSCLLLLSSSLRGGPAQQLALEATCFLSSAGIWLKSASLS